MLSSHGISFDEVSMELDFHMDPSLFATDKWRAGVAREMPRIARETRDFWMTKAGQVLRSSRLEYQQGIVLESVTANTFSLNLHGWLPNAIEWGHPPFDMSPGFKGKIIPLNVDRSVVFSSPTVFRSGSSPGWRHPGFAARNLHNAVIHELNDVIVPAAVERIVASM